MQTQEPAETDRPGGAPASAETVAGTAADSAPLFTGSPTALWLGFGVVAFIFLMVFVLLLRGRAQRGAEKGSKGRPAGTDFFQPAGAGAEITFDDGQRHAAPPRRERIIETEAEVVIDPDEPAGPDDASPANDDAREADEDAPAPRAAPFANLFAGKRAPETRRDEPASQTPSLAAQSERRPDHRHEEPAPVLHEQRAAAAGPVRAVAAAVHDPDEEEEERRLTEIETALTLRRAEDALQRERRAVEEQSRQLAAREAALERERRSTGDALSRDLARDMEARFAALDQKLDDKLDFGLRQRTTPTEPPPSAQEVERAVEQLARDIDVRLAAFSERMETRLAAAPSEHGSAESASPGAVDLIARRLDEQRAAMEGALASLSARIDSLSGAPAGAVSLRADIAALKEALSSRARGPVAPAIQLTDILRNALPPNAFELRAALPNNRRADCLVRLPWPPGPIAIDARFPVEAFNALHAASEDREPAAENEFRRIALRHIVDIAERLIVPDETAESALMFLPSESMFAEMHARFPDVVQDSYRARVWIVSPTTLMATLHTMRAVMRDAHTRESAELIHAEAQHVLAEVDALRRRVVALEEDFNRARSDVRDVLSSTDQVYRRAETIHNTRRTLSETALDRGGRRLPAAPEEPDSEPSHAVDDDSDGDLWTDDRPGTEERQPFPLR